MPTQDLSHQLASIDQAQSRLINLAIEFGPRLFSALLLLAVGHYTGGWVGRLFDKLLIKFELDVSVRQLLVRVVRSVVLVLFMIMALQNLGIDLLPLIAGLGVAGAGVALAMQGVLSNVAAGLTIIFTRPYRVGEYISIAGEEGRVEVVTLFSTTLSHADLSQIVIPNRKIAGEILHNYGNIRQLNIQVGVAYSSDISLVLSTVRELLDASDLILKTPEPLIQVATLADSSITIAVCPWVNVVDYARAVSELNQAMLGRFQQRGISIPYPQQEVRLLSNNI